MASRSALSARDDQHLGPQLLQAPDLADAPARAVVLAMAASQLSQAPRGRPERPARTSFAR